MTNGQRKKETKTYQICDKTKKGSTYIEKSTLFIYLC